MLQTVTCDVGLDRGRTVAVADDRQLAKEIPRPQLPDLLIVSNHRGRSLPQDEVRVTGSALPRERRAGVPLLDVEP